MAKVKRTRTNRQSTCDATALDPVTAYALDVQSGSIIAGPYVRLACERHLRDQSEAEAKGLFWDVADAQRVMSYFADVLTVEKFTTDERGQQCNEPVPFILEPWQAFIVGSLFGWKIKSGIRRFGRAFVEIGKGNGKSPLAAGIGLYMLTALNRVRAEVYAAATKMNQAQILFRDAVAMCDRSSGLSGRLTQSGINPVWQLTNTPMASFFKPISSEKKGQSGPRVFCGLIDEVHEHPDDTVIEMIRAGTKGNSDALIFEITNSGSNLQTVCGQEHLTSIAILKGEKTDESWFAYIAALDDEDDPFKDEACWIKANPNLGVSIQPGYIRKQVVEAKNMPSKEGIVRRLNFCQWAEDAQGGISRDVWTACLAKPGEIDIDDLVERGLRPYGGLDLSRTRDLTALTLTWVLDPTPDAWKFVSKTWFWTPKDTLEERSKSDGAPYPLWVDQGHLEAVPGARISYRWLADAIATICQKYDPQVIGCDQYGLEQLREQLSESGIDLPCVVHPQGFNRRVIGEGAESALVGKTGAEEVALWMPDSVLKFEAALLEKRIMIDPNPVMTMCAANVAYEENRTGHRMFSKQKARGRIDGIVALGMSVGMATLARPEIKSVYETRGIRRL